MRPEAGDAPELGTSRRLLRAALMGLCGGLLFGGFALVALGLYTRLSTPDCTDLSQVQCGASREASVEIGRVQALMGSGLLALGIAGVILLRRPLAPGRSP